MGERFKFADNPGLLQDVLSSAAPGSEEKPPYMGTDDPYFLMKLIAAAYGMENYTPFANSYRKAYGPDYVPGSGGPVATPVPTPYPTPIGDPIMGGVAEVNSDRERKLQMELQRLGI